MQIAKKKRRLLGAVAALAMVAAVLASAPAQAATGDPVLLNEALISHSGTDNSEFIELFGTPGTSLSGLSLIVVEGDGSIAGTIDFRYDFLPFHTLGANGFFTVGNCSGLASNYATVPDVGIGDNSFENSSMTIALVQTASLSGSSVTGSEVVLDTVALTDGGASDSFFFGAPVIGPDGSFFPAGVRRLVDGQDTDSAADWTIASFFLPGDNTPTGGGVDGCVPLSLSIPEIQGAGHLSPFNGGSVTTSGVVTARAFNGYYLQDPTGDENDDTSDGIFVFGGSRNVGEVVEVTGTVSEFIPGGAATGNLSITQISEASSSVTGTGSVEPVVIGSGGRVPPNVITISDDELPVNLQDVPGVFNPDVDGIDFYEALEGMLVTVEDPVAVSATRTFSPFSSEMFTLPNQGANAAPADVRTARGGINLAAGPDGYGDTNPERVQIQFDPTISGGASVPAITVGDVLGDVTGVVGYSFGNYEVNATHEVTFTSAGLGLETTDLVTPDTNTGGPKTVTVASYNVLNLDPLPSDDQQRATLAGHIVDNLGTPDVIALQEIQDNNGTTNDGTTDATLTLQALVDAIVAAGGPTYAFFDVAPADNTSGGAPGGNIRNAFLYNPDRVSLESFVSLTPDELAAAGVGDPNAFAGTRNPLVATFKHRGKEFTVINNHLTSRFGSTPIFGGPHPFVQAGEAEREAQMQALNDYVDYLLSEVNASANQASKDRRIMVVGDLNTFEFTNDLTDILPGPEPVLENLIDSVDDDNVYTFIFDGNSQVLDHFLVGEGLPGSQLDIVHVNVDFPRVSPTVGSDHEPLVALLDL